jgi:TIR domain
VLTFADRLRADGVDAEIDQYNAAPPEGWPLWCERQIEAADVVLMVCTETYHRRVRGDEQPGKGLGAVWEARIIRQLLYDAGAVSNKFVPVLFSDASPEHIPTLTKGVTRYVVDTEDGYEALYRRLTRQPGVVRPALGALRSLPAKHHRWPEGAAGPASLTPPAPAQARRPPGAR